MGTRAHWFSYPWRYRRVTEDGEAGPWIYAETLRDVREDTADTEHSVEVQKRSGTKSSGYLYETYTPRTRKKA